MALRGVLFAPPDSECDGNEHGSRAYATEEGKTSQTGDNGDGVARLRGFASEAHAASDPPRKEQEEDKAASEYRNETFQILQIKTLPPPVLEISNFPD